MKDILFFAVVIITPYLTSNKIGVLGIYVFALYVWSAWKMSSIESKIDKVKFSLLENEVDDLDLQTKLEEYEERIEKLESHIRKSGNENLLFDSPDEIQAAPDIPPSFKRNPHYGKLAGPDLEPKKPLFIVLYPEGESQAAEAAEKNFLDAIKKHLLKIEATCLGKTSYGYKGKINYSAMVDACKKANSSNAIIIGPPSEGDISHSDFKDLLSVTLDVQGISYAFIDFKDVNTSYRYLNCALDLALACGGQKAA